MYIYTKQSFRDPPFMHTVLYSLQSCVVHTMDFVVRAGRCVYSPTRLSGEQEQRAHSEQQPSLIL